MAGMAMLYRTPRRPPPNAVGEALRCGPGGGGSAHSACTGSVTLVGDEGMRGGGDMLCRATSSCVVTLVCCAGEVEYRGEMLYRADSSRDGGVGVREGECVGGESLWRSG